MGKSDDTNNYGGRKILKFGSHKKDKHLMFWEHIKSCEPYSVSDSSGNIFGSTNVEQAWKQTE